LIRFLGHQPSRHRSRCTHYYLLLSRTVYA
jgi:hypothetical protein